MSYDGYKLIAEQRGMLLEAYIQQAATPWIYRDRGRRDYRDVRR